MKVTYRKALAVFIGLVLLLFVVPSLINLVRLAKEYQQGPSVDAALNSYSVSRDSTEGLYYKFVYEDKDAEGNTQYHFISTGGENVPRVVVCKFTWFDEWSFIMLPSRTPAGWQYLEGNESEWREAFIAWIESSNYDGRKMSPNFMAHVKNNPSESNTASS